MIADAWRWLSASDAHVGSALIVLVFVIFVGCFLAFARDEQRKDSRARIEFAPLHRDAAAHEAWVRTFAEEGEPVYDALCADYPAVAARLEVANVDREWQAITDAVENRGPR